jgi:hypothetical protein
VTGVLAEQLRIENDHVRIVVHGLLMSAVSRDLKKILRKGVADWEIICNFAPLFSATIINQLIFNDL